MLSEKVTPKRVRGAVWCASVLVAFFWVLPHIDDTALWLVVLGSVAWGLGTTVVDLVVYVVLSLLADAWDGRRRRGATA